MQRDLCKQLLILMQIVLFIMWPITAAAAQLTFSRSLAQPDVALDLLITLGISVLVGLSSLLSQMKEEYKTNGKIDRLWLFVSSKMSTSTVAGVAMYFGADWMQLSRSATAGAIIFASFSGTLFLERAGNWVFDKFFPAKA